MNDQINGNGNDNNEGVNDGVVYREMYNERRRFRDYELAIAAWYTTILLAIIGIMQSSSPSIIDGKEWPIFFLSTLIIVSAILSINYAHRRNEKLRNILEGNLEPRWYTEAWRNDPDTCFQKMSNPRYWMIIVLVSIWVAIVSELFL